MLSQAITASSQVVQDAGRTWSVAAPSTVLHVDAESAAGLAACAREVAREYGDGPLDHHDLLVRSEIEVRRASARLLDALIRFRITSSPDGVLLIRGLQVDDPLPPTPSTGAFAGPWRDLAVSTITQLMVMSLLGDVIGFADEKEGRVVQDICPLPGAETRQENTGSCLLELHTEDGFHPQKPHFLSLFGLRPDHARQAITVAGGVRGVIGRLEPRHVRVLREPLFTVRLSSSFVGQDETRYCDPMPVLTGGEQDPDLCVDFNGTRPLTEAAQEAFSALRGLMLDTLVGCVLDQGDLLLIDNRKAVHGRTGFTPRYDGGDRWLRRCFAIGDIRTAIPRLVPHSRAYRPLVETG